MIVSDKANSFLDKRLVQTLNTSFKVQSSLDKNNNGAQKKDKRSFRYNRSRKFTISRSSSGDSYHDADHVLKKIVRTTRILNIIENFLGYEWEYESILKFNALSDISMGSSSLDWTPLREREPFHENRSSISRIFSLSFQAVDINAYRAECTALANDIAAMEITKEALEKDCRRLNSFINSEALLPLVNTDEKLLKYLTFKLNCARHGNFHTMKKSAKYDYLKALKEHWETDKKGVIETLQFMTKSVDTLLTLKESLAKEASDIILNEGVSGAYSPRTSTSKSIAERSLQRKAQSSSPLGEKKKGRKGITPLKSSSEITPESTALNSKRESDIKEEKEAINTRVSHSSALLENFNQEMKSKMKSCMELSLNAVRRKYGTLQQLNSQKSDVLSCLINVKSRINHLEYLTASFSKQQEILRKRLLDSQKIALSEAALIAMERRKVFVTRLKEHFDKTEQLLVSKRREKRSQPMLVARNSNER